MPKKHRLRHNSHVPRLYTPAQVTSVDDENNWAWVEFPNGATSEVDISLLDFIEPGQTVQVSQDLEEVQIAPQAPTPQRRGQTKTIALVKLVSGDRTLISINDRVVVVNTHEIVDPAAGAHYYYEDDQQAWLRLSPEEQKAVAEPANEASEAFIFETLSKGANGLQAVGGNQSRAQNLVRQIEANFNSRASGLKAGAQKPPAGAILFGPPGTGKTHLARAVAHEVEADLFSVNGPELISKWVGDTERHLRELFEAAGKRKRAIIFFDEFDTIGARRSPESHDFVNRQVGQLLAVMDGASSASRPFVIAATNRLEDVDPAFLRPGRFDYPVEFALPDTPERLSILTNQSRLHPSVTTDAILWLSAATDQWSPAELGLIWTEAASTAQRGGMKQIALEHVLHGYSRARQQHELIERTRDTWKLDEQS